MIREENGGLEGHLWTQQRMFFKGVIIIRNSAILSTAESQFLLSFNNALFSFWEKIGFFSFLHTKNWKIKHWYVFYCICKGYSHSGSKLLSIIVGGVSWLFQLFVYNLISVWMSFGRDDDDNENKQHSNQLHIKHLASYSLLQKVVIVFFLLQKEKKVMRKFMI